MRRVLLAAVLALAAAAPAWAAGPDAMRVLSFVLLAEPRLPPAADFKARLDARLQDRTRIRSMEADGDKVILLRTAAGTVMVGLIDAPLPRGQLDGLCRDAWYWRTACEETARHKAHAVVAVMDPTLDKLDAHLLQTHVVAALMDANAIASYWGASLQSRQAVLDQSAGASRTRAPVGLWVDFRISNDPLKGFSMSTEGLEAFGLAEIETKDVLRSGREVFALVAGLAEYLVEQGPVVRDGDTIGASPALNIRVRQGPSYWREDATVYRVLFPQ